jgi:SAM-dependent methyltransferase
LTATATKLRTVLHVGCGAAELPEEAFPPDEWREVRVDMDERTEGLDVVADMRNLDDVFEDAMFDGICCMSCLEHIEEGYLGQTLAGFNRVLRKGGALLIVVPALEKVFEVALKEGLNATVEEAACGPVRPLDMLYGYGPRLQAMPLMAHKTGFTRESLATWLGLTGFDGDLYYCGPFYLAAEVRKIGPPKIEKGFGTLFEKKE